MRVDLVPAFVLHTRNFTDSRILAELITADYGRTSVVARSSKKGGRFSMLRPFQPLLVSWQGKSDLKSLIHSELNGASLALAGNTLYCGMYLNELTLRVLAVGDAQPALFDTYCQALVQLAQGDAMEPVLRNFELDLLAEQGYGIPFDVDGVSGMPLVPDARYRFDPTAGFTQIAEGGPLVGGASRSGAADGVFLGETILAMGGRTFSDPEVRLAAKHLCRLALQPLLGGRPLKSRELFVRDFNKT